MAERIELPFDMMQEVIWSYPDREEPDMRMQFIGYRKTGNSEIELQFSYTGLNPQFKNYSCGLPLSRCLEEMTF